MVFSLESRRDCAWIMLCKLNFLRLIVDLSLLRLELMVHLAVFVLAHFVDLTLLHGIFVLFLLEESLRFFNEFLVFLLLA